MESNPQPASPSNPAAQQEHPGRAPPPEGSQLGAALYRDGSRSECWVAADQRPTVPSRLINASEQQARGGDGALSFAVVCASPSMTSTLRVHRHRAVPRLLSHCPLSFLWSTSKPFEFTRPLPRLGRGRGPRCVSSGAFYRRPGGPAFYVSTLPAPLVLTRPPLDSFLSPCCPLKKCGGSGQTTCFPSPLAPSRSFTTFTQRKRRVPSEGERAHIPCDFAYSGFAVAAVGKTEEGLHRRFRVLGMRRTSSDARLRRLIARRP